MGLGTKLRHLSDLNPKKLEAQIEGLPFKVEVKSVNFVGGKWYCHFTLLEKDSFVMDSFPATEDKPPTAKKSKKTQTRKVKKKK